MRKPLMFLLPAAVLVLVAAVWAFSSAGLVVGGNTTVAVIPPGALRLLYGALAVFAIALVVAIHAAVRAWMHRAAPAETPAPPEESAPATY